ncbi:MAG: GAF domain-containing protein [bacterium]|nr:MAG: GAF domain-containing protein [bacterium]
MGTDRPLTGKGMHWTLFAGLLACVLSLYILYGINMILWKDATDYGWRAMYDSGPKVVDEVFGKGWQAGLRVGDTILAVNGRSYETFDELFFEIRNPEPGGVNVYSVLRGGEPLEIHLTNGVLGPSAVLKRSGPLFLTGLLFLSMGVLVYLMKPGTRESRVFLLMTAALGVSISYASPSDLMRPLWLFKVRQFLDVLLPAPIIHLALLFPRRRKVLGSARWLWVLPYLVSLAIFGLFRPLSHAYWNPPPHMDLVNNLYLLLAVVFFVGSTVFNLVRDPSPTIRAQSRMIMLGIFIGMFVPVAELLARHLWGVYLFQDPALSFALLLSAFPLAVGYTIVRHDLFTIDTAVRKTFGYALSSGSILGVYALLAAFLNMVVPTTDLSRSRTFAVLFVIAVVLALRPLHERVQKAVDRVFFRGSVPYKDAVAKVSSALTSVLDLKEVLIRIIHALRDLMSIQSAGVILIQPEVGNCQVLLIRDAADGGGEEVMEDCLDLDDPLVSLMQEARRIITIFDLQEDPAYGEAGKACLPRFESLGIVIAVPLVFQGELTGLLALGRRKSGRFFTSEDTDLLRTLADQGAIAVENARRAERMRHEEVIRANLARYLSPQVVEKVMSSQMDVDLEGDRRDVTVLISDIRDFTRLTRTQAPDRLVAILNEYFTDMAQIIFEYQGSLDKYIGDAIVAVFGSLRDLENHAHSAVRAATDMVRWMEQLNMKWADRFGDLDLQIGIGIASGEVFLGNVGSPERMEFTVLGSAVNTAQMLSEMAEPRQILLSEGAARKVEGLLDLRSLPPVTGKGLEEDLAVFEAVLGDGPQISNS